MKKKYKKKYKKELNEKEIHRRNTNTLSNPKNEIMNLYQDKKELFKFQYALLYQSCLNNPIDPMLSNVSFTRNILSHVIKTNKEIKFLL
jgi:hypothetical protein